MVKVNAPQLVRKELTALHNGRASTSPWAPTWTATSGPKARYQLMPGILRALLAARNPFSILTKGTLILRDLDLLTAAAEVTDVGLSVSVGCTDEELWRTLEPGTPSPQRRLGVCATLTERGLPCGVLMGPVVPYLSDSPAQLQATVRRGGRERAPTHVSPIVLHLRPGAREWFLAWVARAPSCAGPPLPRALRAGRLRAQGLPAGRSASRSPPGRAVRPGWGGPGRRARNSRPADRGAPRPGPDHPARRPRPAITALTGRRGASRGGPRGAPPSPRVRAPVLPIAAERWLRTVPSDRWSRGGDVGAVPCRRPGPRTARRSRAE